MPIGHPRLTITLSVGASALALKRCAETGDQPADYVDDLVRLDCDEVVGYFDGVAEEFEADLAIVKGEMGLPQ